MGRGDPTPQQYKNLTYVGEKKPAFIQRILDGGSATSAGSNGRVPIPERPDGDAHSESDDDPLRAEGDEAPTVVVLKGKHLSKEEARAEDRRARGLPDEKPKSPLPTIAETTSTSTAKAAEPVKEEPAGMSFGQPKAKAKRKAVGVDADSDDGEPARKAGEPQKKKKAKPKAGVKLSFS